MKILNVGIIGYGWAATAHIPAITATGLAKVTRIFSNRSLNAGDLSAQYGNSIRTDTDFDKFLQDPGIDAVSICSHPAHHARQAIAAARAGKHLIIEKPLALSWADCEAIAQAVRESRVQACVCFECRYSSQFLTTRASIDQGLFGTLHYGEVDYYHGIGPWYGQYRWNTRKDGGGSSLLSAGCHAMDALLLCLGNDVETVTSLAAVSKSEFFAPYEYPTTSVTLLKFKSGKIGKVASVIDCLQPYYFHTHLVGSEGSLLDHRFHSTRLGGLNKSKWSELSMKLLDSGDVSDHPYQTQFKAFFEALNRGEPMPLTSLTEALHTHRVIFAADRSAGEGGKPITLD